MSGYPVDTEKIVSGIRRVSGTIQASGKLPEGWQQLRKEYFEDSGFDLVEVESFYNAEWETAYNKVKNDKEILWTADRAVCIAQLGEEDTFNKKAELMRVKGNTVALEILNTADGMVACPEGFCVVFSESSNAYYVLIRADKPDDILEKAPEKKLKSNAGWMKYRNDFFTGTLSGARLQLVEKAFNAKWELLGEDSKPWSTANSMYVCEEGEETRFEGKAELLKRDKFTSLTNAVEILNSNEGRLACPEGYCMIFSANAQLYFVLFREGMRPSVEALFDTKLLVIEMEGQVPPARWAKLRGAVFLSSALEKEAIKKEEKEEKKDGDTKEDESKTILSDARWDQAACTLLTAEQGTNFKGRAKLLKEDEFSSVSATVERLNTVEGSAICPEGFCLVYSKRKESYYLVWRSDKKDYVYKEFHLIDKTD